VVLRHLRRALSWAQSRIESLVLTPQARYPPTGHFDPSLDHSMEAVAAVLLQVDLPFPAQAAEETTVPLAVVW